MINLQRHSPVQFKEAGTVTRERDDWTIVLEYPQEGNGPFLVDLSHKPRFDLQDRNIDSLIPAGLKIPASPGESQCRERILVNRMNMTQASIIFLDEECSSFDQSGSYTDVTEATVLLALLGTDVFRICEKLTALDFLNPLHTPPFLLQGPFCHVPCQVVVLQRAADGDGAILVSCSRGYAESIVHAILDAGAEYGLRPAGEKRFSDMLEKLS